MTTRKPTPGHTTCDHPHGHAQGGHNRSDHTAMATLLGTARVVTKWTLAGGLIAAASYLAGWAERGHHDGR